MCWLNQSMIIGCDRQIPLRLSSRILDIIAALYVLIHCDPPSHLRFHFGFLSDHSSAANFQCRKCFQLFNADHFWLVNSQFFSFDQHLILEFILQGGHWQTKQVAKVIFQTTYIQPHHHVETLTTMLWQSLQYLKYVLLLLFACFEC